MLGSEDDFLALIDEFFPDQGMIVGRGDDCAVFSCPEKLCVTSDLFIEDVHFRQSYFSPFDIGYKALAVNISDIAAMGAKPLGFSLSLAFPPGFDRSFWSDFFSGMSSLARQHSIVLSGGDLSRAEKLTVSITAWGDCSQAYRLRRVCSEGDLIFLVGPVGLARAGFLLLESGSSLDGYSQAAQAHLRPQPQVEAGLRLSGQEGVKAMMDVSDGLVRDLPRLLGKDLGADIELKKDQLHPDVLDWCRHHGENPLEFSLVGGEDYALVTVVDKEAAPRLGEVVPQGHFIGRVREGSGIFLHGKRIALKGFDHFTRED